MSQRGSKHKCPITGCTVLMPRNLLMCAPHWMQVPPELQMRVNKEYRKGISQAYLTARQQAIDAVNNKQPKGESNEPERPA